MPKKLQNVPKVQLRFLHLSFFYHPSSRANLEMEFRSIQKNVVELELGMVFMELKSVDETV